MTQLIALMKYEGSYTASPWNCHTEKAPDRKVRLRQCQHATSVATIRSLGNIFSLWKGKEWEVFIKNCQ